MNTENGLLEDREEQFTEFAGKCTGLESRTVPLSHVMMFIKGAHCCQCDRCVHKT